MLKIAIVKIRYKWPMTHPMLRGLVLLSCLYVFCLPVSADWKDLLKKFGKKDRAAVVADNMDLSNDDRLLG